MLIHQRVFKMNSLLWAVCGSPILSQKNGFGMSGWKPRDATTYIRPFEGPHCPTPATQTRRDQGTPRRISERLSVHIIPPLLPKQGGDQGTPGHISDPLAVRIFRHLPRTRRINQGMPGVYLHLGNLNYSISTIQRKWKPFDATAYSRPLGGDDYPIPGTETRRETQGRQRIGPTLWPYTLLDTRGSLTTNA